MEMWKEAWQDSNTPNRKPKNNRELREFFVEEFDQFTNNEWNKDDTPNAPSFWDDRGRWELINIPKHYGFGIMFGQMSRWKKCINIMKGK